MFKDHFFFPQTLFSVGHLAFPRVRVAWNQFIAGTLIPPQLVIPVPRRQAERAAAAPIPVPRLFRPLLIVGWEEAMATEVLPYEAVWNRFVTVYVDRYPEHNTQPKRFYFGDEGRDHSRQARRGHLKALYWLLVVRPFQEVIRQNRDRFGNIDPDTLTPEEVGGGGGHGPGPGGPGGPGGGRGRGNPPPGRNPPPNPPQRPQPAPAQPSSSSSSSFGSQPQQGTCSAKSVKKSSAPADDGGSPSPPSKKHKPDGPSKGPGGGAGGLAV